MAAGVPEVSPDSILLIDRAYIDYAWPFSLRKRGLYFVTRMKKNMKYTVIGQQEPSEKNGVVSDYRVLLANYYQIQYHPVPLRHVTVVDTESGEHITFITNNVSLDATIEITVVDRNVL